MPIREYQCLSCARNDTDTVYEALVRGNSEMEITCPICKSADKEVKMSGFATRNEAIHASERPIILKNDKGEIRYLANRDMDVHPKYAAQGYKKVEAFTTFKERDEFEKTTNRLHERSHYNPGSNTAEYDCDPIHGQNAAVAKMKRNLIPLGSL